jgi:predicted PurR-regulated permease PerM
MTVARTWAVVTLVSGSIVVAAVVLWALRTVLVLMLVAFTIAVGMRKSVEWLRGRGVPASVAILLHYAVLLGLLALVLVFVVPAALDEVRAALGAVPPSPTDVHERVQGSSGVRREVLSAVERALRRAPTQSQLVHPLVQAGRTILTIAGGVAFTLAVAAYWLVERERALRLIGELLSPAKRQVVLDTWLEVELRLGAYLRGVSIMVVLVSTVLSACYFLLGVPYPLLLGPFSGVIEIVPIVGPLLAGVAAIGVALTVSVRLALETTLVFIGFRLIQDYVINPRVIGGAVDLPPLLVLLSASTVGVALGPAAVALATPLAAICVTVAEVALGRRRAAGSSVLDG